jgi:hypothetical protein
MQISIMNKDAALMATKNEYNNSKQQCVNQNSNSVCIFVQLLIPKARPFLVFISYAYYSRPIALHQAIVNLSFFLYPTYHYKQPAYPH